MPVSSPKTQKTHAKQVSLYLPLKAAQVFRRIAFDENRKQHSIYIEALREWLQKRGKDNADLWRL